MKSIANAVAIAEQVPGWMSRAELHWLAERAAEVPPGGTWLEIGVMVGRSWLCQAHALPAGCRLAAVDIGLGTNRQNEETFRKGHWQWDGEWTWQRTLSLVERHDLRWLAVRDTALQAADLFAPSSLDAVFIDACHTLEGTRSQIHLYREKLKPGGLLCGHDYDRVNWPDVVQAVEELIPDFQHVDGTSLWWCRKGA